MAKIYLVRHGQSLANLEWKYQGQKYDTDLTELGKTQALGIAEKLADKNIAVIFASPLKRARQTAEIITQIFKTPLVFDDLLKETDHGDWSFLNDDEIKLKWPDLYRLWKTMPNQVTFPNGENFANETTKRVIDWWNKLDKNKNTIIVSHENVIQIIITHILGQSLDQIWEHRIKNGDIICVDNDKIEIC